MRRGKPRYDERNNGQMTSPYKVRMMSTLGKLTKPKWGLTITCLLCLLSIATLLLIGVYHKSLFQRSGTSIGAGVGSEETKGGGEKSTNSIQKTFVTNDIRLKGRATEKFSEDNDIQDDSKASKQNALKGEKKIPAHLKEYNEEKEQMTVTPPMNKEYFVLLQLVNAHSGSKFADNFYNCIKSIIGRTKLDLQFLLTVDNVSKETAEKVFQTVVNELKMANMPSRTYLLIEEVNRKVFPYTKTLQQLFSSGEGAYYSHAIFFIAPAMHMILPKSIKHIVMLDTDLQFRADIKELFALFGKMSPTNIMAIATDQQPVYRHVLWSYRSKNPGTKVGNPPPDGLPGFNSGVKLMNVEEMRNSKLYNELLQGQNASRLAKKYDFKGHLGDQDFYSLVSFDFPQLFYTLPCQWNRQLCTWWKNNGYQDVFDMYFKCDGPHYVLHGNCNTPIPKD